MNYYKVLGIDKNSTPDEIKSAYKKMAMKHHPDKNQGNPESEEKFKEVLNAYEILSDPQKKQHYDMTGQAPGNSGGGNPFQGHGFDMNDIFSQFGDIFGGFGGRSSNQRRQRRGNDLRVKVNVDLSDIIFGAKKTIKYNRHDKCSTCSGVGGSDASSCSACNGTGQRTIVQQTPFGQIRQATMCNLCNGEGQIVKNKCKDCSGSGTKIKEEKVEIDLPKGAVNGTYLTMPQFGNYTKSGVAGDLQIVIEEIPDKVFKREENNLIYNQSISVIDAILGKDFEIDSPHGKIKYTIKGGTNHGDAIQIDRKGIPDIHYNNEMGHLYIIASVRMPDKLTSKEVELLNKLKKEENFK